MQIKRFNWFRRASAWDQAQAWRASRAASNEKFFAGTAVFAASFTAAQTQFASGMATLAAQASSERVQAELKAVVSSKFGASVNIKA